MCNLYDCQSRLLLRELVKSKKEPHPPQMFKTYTYNTKHELTQTP